MNPPAPLRTHVGLRLNTFQPATKPAVPSIGPWELVRQVHEGAMFRVHQVRPLERDSSSTAGYALKELLPRWDHVPAAIELLAVESLVGRSVSDPHLVAVLSSELAQKPRYVVTPWLQGETLATIVRRGRLKVPQALWIVRQLVEALRALHSAGWLHGDVKPDNVLVSPRGHVTLIDLGFARRIGERVTSFDDCLRFTATYAPPEITGSQPPDVRSDLYSVGSRCTKRSRVIPRSTPRGSTSCCECIARNDRRMCGCSPQMFPATWRSSCSSSWPKIRSVARTPLRSSSTS